MHGDPETRKLLGRIVSSENAENWYKPELFEQHTRNRLPKELRIVEPPPDARVNYNCFIHVLGLQKDPNYVGEEHFKLQNFEEFLQSLIRDGELKRLKSPEADSMVVYRMENGHISHVGLVEKSGKIISKWSWGPLVEHDVWDVPDHYGNVVEFYTGVETISKKVQSAVTSTDHAL